MAKAIKLCKVHSINIITSPILCQRTTVWNTDAPNRYITRWLFVSDCLPFHHQFNRGWVVSKLLKFMLNSVYSGEWFKRDDTVNISNND